EGGSGEGDRREGRRGQGRDDGGGGKDRGRRPLEGAGRAHGRDRRDGGRNRRQREDQGGFHGFIVGFPGSRVRGPWVFSSGPGPIFPFRGGENMSIIIDIAPEDP